MGENDTPAQPEVPDYSGEAEVAQPDENAMARLRRLYGGALELKLKKLQLEDELSKVTSALETYQQTLIPNVMQEIGAEEIKIRGTKITVKDTLIGTFPKDEAKRQEAFAYIRRTGNDGMIKREITVRYGKGFDKKAAALMEHLREIGVTSEAEVENSEEINHQTMLAFLRQELREGREVPLPAFGVFERKVAEIKLPTRGSGDDK